MPRQPLHVLLIDDDPNSCFLMQTRLLDRVTCCTVLTRCEDALQFIGNNASHLNVILLDLRFPMGSMQGIELVHALQKKAVSHPRIVVVTNMDMDSMDAREAEHLQLQIFRKPNGRQDFEKFFEEITGEVGKKKEISLGLFEPPRFSFAPCFRVNHDMQTV
jgi:DNA-binding NtrC family response regulator